LPVSFGPEVGAYNFAMCFLACKKHIFFFIN